ncbi:hypothetical protein ACSZOO_18655 [Aeromonas hydrophila]
MKQTHPQIRFQLAERLAGGLRGDLLSLGRLAETASSAVWTKVVMDRNSLIMVLLMDLHHLVVTDSAIYRLVRCLSHLYSSSIQRASL